MFRVWCLILCGALVGVALSAPRLEPKTEETSGTFRSQMDSPTLSVVWWDEAEGKAETTVYWLVFLRDADEMDFIKSQNDGQRLIVTGNRRKGGRYHYIIVESFKRIEP